MKHFVDALKALKTTLVTAARKPTTVEYPEVERPRLERYRTTSFALLHDEHGEEACIGCLQCERICPSQVITIVQGPKRESAATGKKRGWIEDFTLDMSACIFCELCVQVCPTDAIAMTHTGAPPARTREDLLLTMEKLYANEKGLERSWGIGSRLMGMQEDPDKKKPAPKAAAKPVAKPAAKPVAAKPAAAKPKAEPAAGATEGKNEDPPRDGEAGAAPRLPVSPSPGSPSPGDAPSEASTGDAPADAPQEAEAAAAPEAEKREEGSE
ncbi:MAG: 4Fe-4S binding protein [Myxococcales bacterium]|nr:4Fe-4S binding protein [Myxococcales bacterium]